LAVPIKTEKQKKIVVDFSSFNVAKEIRGSVFAFDDSKEHAVQFTGLCRARRLVRLSMGIRTVWNAGAFAG
jgi:hypothetical protein